MDEQIIEKIRKLQALAERAGTEAEAALAAEKVAALCRQHNLDIGVARLEQEETTATEGSHGMKSQVWQAHWSSLTGATAAIFNVGVYKKPVYSVQKNAEGFVVGTTKELATVFYGLKASVASALVTYNYLIASVESMLEGYINTGNNASREDRRSFRLGCARRIYDESKRIHHAALQLNGTTESMALVRLENQLITRYALAKKLTAGRRSHVRARPDAYQAGYAAGGRVDLHGARTSRMLAS